MKLEWQRVNFDELVRVVHVLSDEKIYNDNVVAAGFYSGNMNKGAFYSDPSEIMSDSEYMFTSIDVELEYMKEILDYDDEDFSLGDLTAEERKIYDTFKYLEKIEEKENLYLKIDYGYDGEKIKIYTKNEVAIAEFTHDAMNGHAWNGTIDEAIDQIVEIFNSGVVRKDIWEVVRFVGFKYGHEMNNITPEEFLETVEEYFDEVLDSIDIDFDKMCISVMRNYVFCKKDGETYRQKLLDFYSLQRSQGEYEYTDFDELVAQKGDLFVVSGELYDEFAKPADKSPNLS